MIGEAKLERIDYVANTYACPECKDSLEPTFAKDFVKDPLVPHSYVSSGLAAYVMYAKFINALPYYCRKKINAKEKMQVRIHLIGIILDDEFIVKLNLLFVFSLKYVRETLIKCFPHENRGHKVPFFCDFLCIHAKRSKEILIKSVFP